MGHYISIRGWIECPEGQVDHAREIIASFVPRAKGYLLSKEGAEFYNRGWIIPDDHINWTHYIFYGGDIRIQCLAFIKDQIVALGKEIKEEDGEYIDRINGLFDIEDEMREVFLTWRILDGEFI